MIRFQRGNILKAQVEALVNTVNEIGVMGKGIALQFSEAFPESAGEYVSAAKRGDVRVGRVLVTRNPSLLGPKWIIHFPTKKHWRQPSQIQWIHAGLKDLARTIRREGIQSIALPPLGCGNGGLDWTHVKRAIESYLSDLDATTIVVYEPTQEYQNSAKRSGVEALTPARALIAELVRRYGILGIPCSILEIQKLAWVLSRAIARERMPDPLALRFEANRYGPYADNLRFLLDQLDGSYLHCERRLADARPVDAIWFESGKRDEVKRYLATTDAVQFLPALATASAVIEGFESPLGMELLTTVDWLVHEQHVEPEVNAVRAALADWPAGAGAARRKARLFDERLIALALDRLKATKLGVGEPPTPNSPDDDSRVHSPENR